MIRGVAIVTVRPLLRYIKSRVCTGSGSARPLLFKCFILLHFARMRRRISRPVVQCTKNPLTWGLRLP
jgi:hypothetical protein